MSLPSVSILTLLITGNLVAGAPVLQDAGSLDLPPARIGGIPLKAVDKRLFGALRLRDAKKVGWLLAHGADPNATDGRETTALGLAAGFDSPPFPLVRLLLDRGADVNGRDLKGGSTVLISAITERPTNVAIVEYLLDRGARADYENLAGETALSTAVREGAAETVDLLLRKGANVNPAGRSVHFSFPNASGPGFTASGNTPAFEAVLNWNPKIFQLLTDHGVDLRTRDAEGFTLLHYAVWAGNAEAVRQLTAKGLDVDAISKSGYTPLQLAIANDAGMPDPAIVSELLRAGASRSLKNPQGKTAEDLLADFVKAGGSASLGNTILALLDPKAPPFHAEQK